MVAVTDIIIEECPEINASECEKFVLFANSSYRTRLKKATKLIENNWKHTINEFIKIGRIHSSTGPIQIQGVSTQNRPSVEPLNAEIATNWYHCYAYDDTTITKY